MNLQLLLSFDNNVLFVTESVFISEQIIKCRFGTLLEISNTFSCKLNVFSHMNLQCWLSQHLGKLHNHTVRLKNNSFAK